MQGLLEKELRVEIKRHCERSEAISQKFYLKDNFNSLGDCFASKQARNDELTSSQPYN